VAIAVHPGQTAEALRQVYGGVPEDAELQVVHPRLGDHAEAPENTRIRLIQVGHDGVGRARKTRRYRQLFEAIDGC
jgi:hypothetical protein